MRADGYKGALTEIITIYRKMKKGREAHHLYKSRKDQQLQEPLEQVPEPENTVLRLRRSEKEEQQYQMLFNFCALDMHNPAGIKYLFYSKEEGLLQSQYLENLADNISVIFKTSFFWLNVFNPTDADLQALGIMFNIHDLTLLDIKERNTDEKIEVFKHYTFISMKLIEPSSSEAAEDVDFNILVFRDFVLTFHDKPWVSVQDTFNFIDLLSQHTALTPSWVLYSIVIELLQDIKYFSDNFRAETIRIQEQSKTYGQSQMACILKQNFSTSCQVHAVQGATRSKIEILSILRSRCRKRVSALVQGYLSEAMEDLKDICKRLSETQRMLERAQDTYLALINVAQTEEGNKMNKSMGRMTLLALIFSPCQLLSGMWGMNVKVPFDGRDGSLYPFVGIVSLSMLPLLLYFYSPIWHLLSGHRKQ